MKSVRAPVTLGPIQGSRLISARDWLDTERVRSDMTTVACEAIVSLPFGDGQTTSGSCGDPSPMHFTGQQRDAESGLDHFGARYNASSMGRFISSNQPFVDQNADFPQSWNLYTYALNNPERYVDPTGEYHTSPEGFIVGDKDGECLDSNNGTVCWSEKNQQWETPTAPAPAPALTSWQQFLNWKRDLVNNWNQRIADVKSRSGTMPPNPYQGITAEDILMNVMTIGTGAFAPGQGPLARDATGKVHGEIPDHVPENWNREDLEQSA